MYLCDRATASNWKTSRWKSTKAFWTVCVLVRSSATSSNCSEYRETPSFTAAFTDLWAALLIHDEKLCKISFFLKKKKKKKVCCYLLRGKFLWYVKSDEYWFILCPSGAQSEIKEKLIFNINTVNSFMFSSFKGKLQIHNWLSTFFLIN